MAAITQMLAAEQAPPRFIENKQPERPAARMGARVFIGGMPNYTANVAGTEIDGVIGGSPAEKAGLKAKDVIVEVAGKKIENVQDYSAALQAMKVGEPVKFVVLRDSQRVELTVTPGSRQ
jgi:S1-C subfamily serine protease